MDKQKIAFVIVKENKENYQEQLTFLQTLEVPVGFSVEIVSVDRETSYARAYNQARQVSDAKYKIYLAESTRILYAGFLQSVLELFREKDSIGLIGMQGTEQLPTSGWLADASRLYGRVLYVDGMVTGESFAADYQEVMAVDGSLIATQYDIPWREDLFHGRQLSVQSLCQEYRRQGYACVIPAQDDFWVIFPEQEPKPSAEEQNRFLDEYSKDCYPLVSVIIPTYQRPGYLAEALASVVGQSYRNLDIFITDNSHDEETKNLLQARFLSDLRIHYEYHPEYDEAGNWQRAMDYNNPAAEYVNWLMDDDIFHPEKIARMMDYFFRFPDVSLVTSYRQLIDGNSCRLPDADFNKPLVTKTTRFTGDMMGRSILMNQINYIGEPTTALAKKRLMRNGYALGWSGWEGKYLLSDVPTWLQLLTQGNLIYIREPLSYFRIHAGQGQNTLKTRVNGQICWAMVIKQAVDTAKFFTDDEQKRCCILSWIIETSRLFLDMGEKELKADNVQDLQRVYQAMAKALSNGYAIQFMIDT